MVWASTATLQTAASAFHVMPKLSSRYELVKACVWAACGIAHASVACGSRSILEWVARFAAYYSLCAQVYFSKEVLVGVDNSKHVFLTPHLCLHVLFTHVYITISAVCIFTSIHSYVFFFLNKNDRLERNLRLTGLDKTRGDETNSFEPKFDRFESDKLEKRDKRDDNDEENVLLKQLRHAQAAKMV